MKRTVGNESFSITHLFIYALAFLLLWEWLKPIPAITDTGEIHVFVWFALFCAILTYVRLPVLVTIPALIVGSLYGLHTIFNGGSFLTREGMTETVTMFLNEVSHNVALIFSWELSALSNYFRTFLLFLLLALVCYLLYFWIFHTKKIFFFLLSTVIYITVLDTFTVVDASMAIIRVVVISFFMLTLMHMLKVQQEEKEIGRKTKTFISTSWMYTLIVMILIASSVGYAAPKFEPQWSDPVPTFKRLVGQEGSGGSGKGVRRVGYGEDDQQLGGGFIQDNNTVFYAETDESVYWRGESKHEYTGQGWLSEPVLQDSYSVYQNEVDYYMYRDNVEVEEKQVKITMEEGVGFSHLFYPGQLTSLVEDTLTYSVDDRVLINPDHLTFTTDVIGGKITAQTDNEAANIRLMEYDLHFDNPKFSLNALKDDSNEDPENIRELYLQLPDDLPDRVSELAEEIVADYDNRYDKVVAVEQYFSKNGFEYETTNVPIPEENQDYVDQFLFETQYGYCDNFSTSMAVLLRTLDIPTRWVKGFTPGKKKEDEDGNIRYEVTNSNAHSWVEVYFPEAGWVPFEPTKGFNNTIEFYEEEEETEDDTETETNDNATDEEEQEYDLREREDLMEMIDDERGSTGGGGIGFGNSNLQLSDLFSLKSVIISIIVTLLVIVFYRKQNQFQTRYFLLKYRLLGKDEQFLSAYERLLWMLGNEGIPRKNGETLWEYAVRVDRILGSVSMKQLTKTYEKIYYGGQVADGEWAKQRQGWEQLVKKLSS